MIFSLSAGDKNITADTVEYGDSNVAQALDSLVDKDVSLTNSVNTLQVKDVELTNSINSVNASVSGLNTKSDVMSSAIATLENELTANGTRIYLDYKDGKYGYNTSALRGADTFSPFKSGGNEYNVINTFNNNPLSTIYGHGYITFTRTGGSNTDLDIFIDDNSIGFYLYDDNRAVTLFFQKKIQFSGTATGNTYLYQTILSDDNIDSKYSITQGDVTGTPIDLYGKGKVVLSSKNINTGVTMLLDGNNSMGVTIFRGTLFEVYFSQSIKLTASNSKYHLSYIAYTEL